MSDAVEQLTLFDLDICAGRMYLEPSPAEPQKARTSVLSWRKLLELKTVPVQCLDLTPGHGNLLGQSFWEINSAWLGVSWTLSTGVSPSVAKESSLSQILQDNPPRKYYLSRTACLGILRRADARGKELPFQPYLTQRRWRSGWTGLSMCSDSWFFCGRRFLSGKYWIRRGGCAYAERNRQRKLHALDPLPQRPGRQCDGLQ